ncbi:4-hydroxybenzoate polyprenyltransferase, mitochondrial-like [Symsagittifera roscoffensis]|uniref:4-hydroxybenzoate polyprenyltransferase, mitochondrial-like n=1 Tax=Symsagittifera roscoffensis TaxID=84072 RepID=UPI00307B1133
MLLRSVWCAQNVQLMSYKSVVNSVSVCKACSVVQCRSKSAKPKFESSEEKFFERVNNDKEVDQDYLKKQLSFVQTSVTGGVKSYAKILKDHGVDSTSTAGEKLVQNAPTYIQPYLKLARVDKPVGYWLLLWPGLTGLALGSGGIPGLVISAKFCMGAILMRSIGCTINDIWDSELDKNVQRTMSRPLASGDLTIKHAVISGGLQSAAALAILLSLNNATVGLGLLALPLVGTYPYMKRITYYPQAFLGLCMNYGLLMGVTATTGALSLPACAMYASMASWTVFYDTIYALQDKKDDMLIGVKSTALKFGPHVDKYLLGFAAATSTGLFLSGKLAEMGGCYYFGVGVASLFMLNQVQTLKPDNADDCMKKFVDNTKVAVAIFTAVMLGSYF